MIFDYLNDLLFTKKKSHINDVDTDSTYNLYMVNRWVSMHSPECAQLVNMTSNRLHSTFTTKRDSYTFLYNILPKLRFAKIQYIKKNTESKTDNNDCVKFLSRKLELSEREINYYIANNNLDIERYKKLWAH